MRSHLYVLFGITRFSKRRFFLDPQHLAAVFSLLPTNGCFDPNRMPTNQVMT